MRISCRNILFEPTSSALLNCGVSRITRHIHFRFRRRGEQLPEDLPQGRLDMPPQVPPPGHCMPQPLEGINKTSSYPELRIRERSIEVENEIHETSSLLPILSLGSFAPFDRIRSFGELPIVIALGSDRQRQLAAEIQV